MPRNHLIKLAVAALPLGLSVAVFAALPSPSAGATETQTICHNGTTIEVPHELVWQHIDEQGNPQPGEHANDYLGACTTTTTTVPDTTTTTTPPPTIPPPVVVCNVDGRAVEVQPGAPCPVPAPPDFTG